MKKITLLITLLLAIVTGSYGQSASSYGFSSSSGTYTDNSAAATTLPLVRADSYISPTQNIGFTFAYEGVNYTQFKMSSNGFISLSAGVAVNLNTNDFSTANAPTRPIIAPLWDDLDGAGPVSSVACYEMTGVSPNRVLTVEWRNWEWNWQSTTPVISFQVKLYETTNVIDFVYRQEATAINVGGTLGASIGIGSATGSGAGSFLNVTNVTTTAVSSTTSTTTILTKPATGQIFTFTPPVLPLCTDTPIAGTVTPANQNVCSNVAPANLVGANYSSGVTGITFQWQESNDDGVSDAWANVVGGAGATTATYTPPAFLGGLIYYRLNVICSASGLSAQTDSVTISSPNSPATQASALNFTNGLYTSLTANWTNGNGARRVVVISDGTVTDLVNNNAPAFVANPIYIGSGEQIVYDGTGSTVNIYGLNCNTTYNFKVFEYIRCGAGPYDYYYNVSSGTNVNSFLTLTPTTTALPVSNNFTGFTGANLSAVFPGWYESDIPTVAASTPTSTYPGTAASVWTNSITAFPGVTTAKVNLFTDTRNAWIISPKMLLDADSRVLFKAAITEFASGAVDPNRMIGTDDKVQVMVSTDGCGSTWANVYTFNASNTASLTNVLTDYNIDLAAYTGQTVQIAFRATDGPLNDSPDYDFHITDVKIEATPLCSQPLALGATVSSSSVVDLTWSPGGSESLWNIEYGPTGFTQGTGTIVNGEMNSFYTATGLLSNTIYQYYVQADCGGANGTSTWAGPFSFTTYCDSVTTFTQNFDGVTVPALPSCWNKVGTTGTVNTQIASPSSAPNTLYIYGTSATDKAIIRTIPVSNLGAGTSWLKLKMRANVTVGGIIEIGYLTNPTDATSFNVIGSVTAASLTYQNYTFSPPAGSYSDYLAFRHTGAPANSILIDDVVWETIPSCLAPSGLIANNFTANSADFVWTPGGSESLWNIEYGPTGFTQGTGTIVNGEINSFYTATGLSGNTTYQYYVQADCGGSNGTSTWTGPFSFTTYCNSVTDFTQNFDSVTAPAFPTCWGKVGITGTVNVQATNPSSAPNTIIMNSTSTSFGVLKTIPVSNLGAGTHWLKFRMRGSAAVGGIVQIGYLTNPADITTFVTLGSVTATSLTYQDFSFVPPAGSYTDYLALKHTGVPSNSVLIDNMIWEAVPSCIAPSGLTATNVTLNSADLSWTPGGSETLWNIEYGLSGFTQGTGTIITGEINPFLPASGLTSNSPYQYYVQANCGGINGTSTWSGPFSFFTGHCIPVGISALSYINNFVTTTGGVNITNNASGFSANNYGNFYPSMTVSGAPNTSFNFNADIVGPTVGCAIWVDWNNDLIFNALTETVYNTTAYGSGPFTGTIAIPAATPSGNYRMRVMIDFNDLNPNDDACQFTSGRGEVEDYKLNVDSNLSTATFDSVGFLAYPNPVIDVLNLSYTRAMSNVSVHNLLGQTVLNKNINAASSQLDLSKLSNGTYLVKITIDDLVKTIKIVKE